MVILICHLAAITSAHLAAYLRRQREGHHSVWWTAMAARVKKRNERESADCSSNVNKRVIFCIRAVRLGTIQIEYFRGCVRRLRMHDAFAEERVDDDGVWHNARVFLGLVAEFVWKLCEFPCFCILIVRRIGGCMSNVFRLNFFMIGCIVLSFCWSIFAFPLWKF